jgi:hypothetical protein
LLSVVDGQQVALGSLHRHRTVIIAVSHTSLAVELDDGEVVPHHYPPSPEHQGPAAADHHPSGSLDHLSHISCRITGRPGHNPLVHGNDGVGSHGVEFQRRSTR